jgi:transcriptional regulator with XRE-family HTH domain
MGLLMTNSMTTEEWEATLGRQLRDVRLRQNVDQRRLAEQAGVALNAVKNLEAGKGATVKSLVKVLRALGRVEWMDSLAPVASISPLQMLKSKPSRQRASRGKGTS